MICTRSLPSIHLEVMFALLTSKPVGDANVSVKLGELVLHYDKRGYLPVMDSTKYSTDIPARAEMLDWKFCVAPADAPKAKAHSWRINIVLVIQEKLGLVHVDIQRCCRRMTTVFFCSQALQLASIYTSDALWTSLHIFPVGYLWALNNGAAKCDHLEHLPCIAKQIILNRMLN